ncbi:uncharacterized protein LOC144135537 isoform X2 [Amblyomma americanum]
MDARVWLLWIAFALGAAWCVAALSNERALASKARWIEVPRSQFARYRKIAQQAVYVASRIYKYLYHVAAIKRVRYMQRGKHSRLKMKLKLAESVCKPTRQKIPKTKCPPRPRPRVRMCELDLTTSPWNRRRVYVRLECERRHH